MNVLVLEPWLGGSHETFVATWRRRSRHALDVRGQAPRHWRWRVAASAWALGRELAEAPRPDVVFASAYLDVSRWAAFAPPGWEGVPVAAYFHENQLTYPVGTSGRDLDYAFANVLTAIAADGVAFNSRFHRDELATAAEEWLRRMPKPTPHDELAEALAGARVFPPGPDLSDVPLGPGPGAAEPLTLAFPHRLEHDKDPLAFLDAVRAARARGADLALVLLGQRFREAPPGVEQALEELAPITRWSGHAPRPDYLRWLGAADVVVSTARHEFFGVATVEALAAGCAPLLPARLAYPELLEEWQSQHADAGLYSGAPALVERLVALAADPATLRRTREANRAAMARFDAQRWVSELDDWLEALCCAS